MTAGISSWSCSSLPLTRSRRCRICLDPSGHRNPLLRPRRAPCHARPPAARHRRAVRPPRSLTRANFARKDEFGDLGRAFDQMAGRIEQLVAEQRRLLQDISHELRSPLTRLGYAIELARTGSNREEAFARTKKEVDRLTTLVTALLEATRAEGELVRRVEDVALGDLAAAVVDDCATEAATRPCQLVLNVSDPVTVLAAPDMIRRAVENVLYNSISHAPAGSAVDVTVARSADHGTITIRDRGPGVPDEHLDDIFKPFFRIDTDRNRETGGVGLGLAIARSAVSLHHGRISARNADPGLEVLIELPV